MDDFTFAVSATTGKWVQTTTIIEVLNFVTLIEK